MIAPPQTGVAALLKNPPAPGEAQGIQQAIPAMQPKASAPTSAPQSFVTPLKGRDLQQLLQEFNNPQSQYPKYAVLTAMKDRQEADRLKSALQGQNAMQQAKQQGTVADAIVAGARAGMPPPPRMMATGGPVAFERGGAALAEGPMGLQDPELKTFGASNMYPSEEDAAQKLRQLRQAEATIDSQLQAFGNRQRVASPAQFQALQDAKRQISQQREMAEGIAEASKWRAQQSWEKSLGPVPSAQAGAMPPAVAAAVAREQNKLPVAGYSNEHLRTPGIGALVPPTTAPTDKTAASSSASSRVSSATRTPTGIAPEDNSGTLKAYEQADAALKGQMTLPPELTKSYEGLAKMRAQQLAEERAAAQAYGKNSLAARDAALAKADTPLLRDPRGLLAIAAGIDTGKGKGFKSLAASTEKYLGGKDAAKTAAAEKYELSQEKLRGMETINRQMAVLNEEKNTALMQGQYDRANQLQQAISKLALERENFLTGRKDKAADRALEERKLAVQRESAAASRAAASRMTPQEFLYDLYKKGELPGFLAAQQDPKTEGALVKDMIAAVAKQPWTLSTFPPEMQAIIKQEMLKLGVTSAPPSKDKVRD